jgi:hypothetical protein
MKGRIESVRLVKAISGDRFQIGNHRGGIKGWIGVTGVLGKCIRIEP